MDPAKAENHRTVGNAHMSEGRFLEALAEYEHAVEADPQNHIHYGNRSVANLKLERYAAAADDAHTAVVLNPQFHRGHARKGIALMAMGDYLQAQVSLQKVKLAKLLRL